MLFGNPECASAGFSFGLVLVWFVVSVGRLKGKGEIEISELQPEKNPDASNWVERWTIYRPLSLHHPKS